MGTPSNPSGASTAAPATTLSDTTTTTPVDGPCPMEVTYNEQLPTPENSRSETSSNNDNASTDDTATLPRRSTRATRGSLRKTAMPEGFEPTFGDGYGGRESGRESGKRSVSGETLVNNSNNARRSQSSLRHSIAVMQSAQWSESTLAREDEAEVEAEAGAAGDALPTPVSKSSQEPQADEGSSLQQRTLRKRVESALAKDDQGKGKGKTRKSTGQIEPVRRSSRLSLVEKATDMIGRAGSVLGKRSRDMMEKGKEVGRRASLRPRQSLRAPKENLVSAAADVPAAKKRRVSEGDSPLDLKGKENAEEPKPVVRYKPKRWLTQGLYTGQEPSDSPPRQNKNKTSKRRAKPTQRTFLPMPMFAGARLLETGRNFKLPFDVFSPLPPGQPKPNEWRKTNKNVFVGEAGGIWRANKRLELSKCLCTEETGCDDDCQNRFMFYECDDSNCGVGRQCGNRNFNELKQRTKAGGKYNVGVEVIKTTDRGYGVRSNRTFEPNQIIVEYTGEIITQTECERRMRTVYKDDDCYYLMYFDQNMIIDATRGSIARFVNHSCQPNCRMEKWTVAGKPRMALFAGDRGVMTGEELSYDYNFDPYSQKNVQECRCGSEKCRGVLGPRPREKERKPEDRKTTAQTGTKRKSRTDDSVPRATKRRKMLAPKSIKKGVQKVVTKARATVSRSTTKKTDVAETKPRGRARKQTKDTTTTTTTTARGRGRGRGRATTTIRGRKAATGTTQSRTSSTTRLNRPSAETKKNAAKGTTPRRRLTKAKKDEPQKVRKRNNQYTKGTAKRGNPGKGKAAAAAKRAVGRPKKSG